ncbi:hypothetical protein SAMN05661093_06714 [Kibdelosporangium aridum]|uniref:Alpha/beta hydrolase n=2 Tax=Kibdelosporangium aridum TaxID=2030 RepID=A0A1Y5XYK3_KIBAR|nr:hypothetical protein SAMN05661093_06714 [Kibdelosporangium aridum]
MTVTGPPYREKLISAATCDEPVIAVGHSGAGALLPAIADTAIFVDALLPHPGQSWFDIAPPPAQAQLRGLATEGELPPWHEWFAPEDLPLPDGPLRTQFLAEIPRLPLAYFAEPAPVTPAIRQAAYIRLSEPYDTAADHAERLGWFVHRENAHHLAILTDPEQMADLIMIGLAEITLA